ncbi:MAG: trypsin-like peptidase domain-containing protein [Eubacterium sp.]|nr:trypsin-like peptidase domain-containing protein [Eubacterium sp.]
MDDYFNNSGNTPEQNNQETPIGGYYVPPTQQNAEQYQAQQTYYKPPVTPQTPPQYEINGSVPLQPKKKKNHTLTWIIVLIAVCAVIGVAGIAISVGMQSFNSNSSSSNNTTQSQKADENGDDSASASVVGSNEAAKKDSDGNLTAAGVAEKTKNSCVGITVYTQQSAYSYFYNYGQGSNSGESVASGEGSGVIMSESNGKTYIITCAHVIADGSSFTVTLDNDKEYEAKLVGYDSQTDIGVLSINATGLQVAEFGDSKDIEVGEDCIAIGCPGGLTFKNSVTRGIVSALDVPVSSQIGYNNECIQVDAAINPGNSGGALFNMQGQVIGINSSKIASTEYEGMGFAVPSNTAIETANSLIKNGYVAGRAKLGITYNTLANYNSANAILNALENEGFKNAEGTMVIQEIDSESDLKNSDIKQYDMIVAIDGKTLTSVDIMTSALSKKKPGDTVTLTIARIQNNSLKTFEVKCKLIESKE